MYMYVCMFYTIVCQANNTDEGVMTKTARGPRYKEGSTWFRELSCIHVSTPVQVHSLLQIITTCVYILLHVTLVL